MIKMPQSSDMAHILPYTWWGIYWRKLVAKKPAVLWLLAGGNALFVLLACVICTIVGWNLVSRFEDAAMSGLIPAGVGLLFLAIAVRRVARDTVRLVNYLIRTRGDRAG